MKKHKNSVKKKSSKFKKLRKKYTAGVVSGTRNISGRAKRVVLRRHKTIAGGKDAELEQAIQTIPRITNETVAEHREEVLSSARKYIYPLKHSTHRKVIISVGLSLTVLVIFFIYCILSLYRFQSTSGFIYGVTQVIPFPIAREGNHFISYENYLFELRHYIHYYQTQQKVDFNSTSGKRQLDQFKTQALNEVVNDEYINQLAQQNGVKITSNELNNEIYLLQQQNRLGSSNQVFETVLKDFWGWSITDFRRELKQQMLAQAVASKLDTGAHQKAQYALSQLEHGASFADMARQYSDDSATSDNGGAYGFSIDRSNRDVPPQVVNALFQLKAGQFSNVIDTGQGLEIVEVNSVSGDQIQASHIFIAYNDTSTYIQPLKNKEPAHLYIKVN